MKYYTQYKRTNYLSRPFFHADIQKKVTPIAIVLNDWFNLSSKKDFLLRLLLSTLIILCAVGFCFFEFLQY